MLRAKRRLLMRKIFMQKGPFIDPFKELKVIEYLINLINSNIASAKCLELFQFSSDLIGRETAMSLIAGKDLDIRQQQNEDENSFIERITAVLSITIRPELLKKHIIPYLKMRHHKILSCLKPNELQKRLAILKNTFRLTDKELNVIIFYFLLESSKTLGKYLWCLGDDEIIDFSIAIHFLNYGHIPLGLKRIDVSKVLTDEKLFNAELLYVPSEHNCLGLRPWCFHYLAGTGKADLSHEFFSNKNDASLKLSDFGISEEELLVLDRLLRSASGHNILFYGESGTGKTSLAKCLAKTYRKELLSVCIPKTGQT